MSKIFFLCGKSASGKDSLFVRLKETLKVKTIVPYTTRPKRAGEIEGEAYHFTDEAKLSQLLGEGRVIELRQYDTVYGIWKYFTVDDGQIDLSHNDYLVIGTLEALEGFVKYFGGENVVALYVEVPDGERLKRAIERENMEAAPRYEEICRRFLADSKDFSEEKIKNAGITKRYINLDFEKCFTRIKEDIEAAIQ